MKIALLLPVGILLASHLIAERKSPTPKSASLQIYNGSTQEVEVFWQKSATERVPNGRIKAGEQTTLETTIGHSFTLLGLQDKQETTIASEVPVQAYRFGGVPAFYTQIAHAQGFPIVASAKVNPYALKEAVYIVDKMLAKRPDVRTGMIKSGARLSILSYQEFTTDQPEWEWLAHVPEPDAEGISTRDYRDARARGMGGSLRDPYCSCAEENLLAYPGDPYAQENILIHEFAHNMHLRGLVNVDPTFDPRLEETYNAAMKEGLWKGKYASTNHHEYFAEGVQSWFDNNRENDHDHNHVNTRAELLAYDPKLAALCREVFGDTEFQYTKPQTRLTGHLEGYDPTKAPTFAWPERLQKAQQSIRKQAEKRSAAATKPEPSHELREILGWKLHLNRQLLNKHPEATAKALQLLEQQLAEIKRVVPAAAVTELQKVPLWFSPEYPKTGPRAEYHPGADWLQENGRDPAMAQAVEFTNIPQFEEETRRMPNFALHELAHAYHHRFLRMSFANIEIKKAHQAAVESGKYENVERKDAAGRTHKGRAYALTNPQEYFAEGTEAFFTTNDFFPYNRAELAKHDPELLNLLKTLWQVE